MDVARFLSAVREWAARREDVKGVLLVGSFARGTAREDSDVDLVILTTEPQPYVDSIAFAEEFGAIARWRREDWGKVTSMRVWYQDGPEVEYGITRPDWAATPLDPGTEHVIADGVKIVYDRDGVLGNLEDRGA